MRALEIAAVGFDSGSTTAKIVGVDRGGQMTWHHLEDADPAVEVQAERLIALARDAAGAEAPVVATGYGRNLVKGAAKAVTEITCHARGVYRAAGSGSLIDIGGQDSKVIVIGKDGVVVNFSMNDKCAAGTGRFLEVMARRLKLTLDGLSEAALSAEDEVPISSTCTVFAESEIISLIAHGKPVPQIVRGLHRALIKRVVSQARAAGAAPPLLLSGGVAQSRAMRELLSKELGHEVRAPSHPQLMGAYGAALLALERAKA